MTRRLILALLLISVLTVAVIPASVVADEPSRGNYVPADVGTQIHPFIERLKFQSNYGSATLLERTEKGWNVELSVDGKSRTITISPSNNILPSSGLESGEQVLVKWDKSLQEEEALLVDYDRRFEYLVILLASLGLCAVVGGWITVRSMSGVIVGLLFFHFWAAPSIQHGSPVLLQIGLFYTLVTLLVLPSSLGWNWKALSAVTTALATGVISLLILIVCANWIGVVGLRNETLRVIEYAVRYFPDRVEPLSLRNMVIGAVLIGSLGVILDVSVDVTSSAAEIAQARPDLPFPELLKRTLTVSTRLVGTMTNTLLLAYVGTDLFLILTVYILPTPTWITLNQDFVAMEVLRGLGGALGFLAAVPLAVVFYVLFNQPGNKDEKPSPPGESTS
jgi:uncharacterized membrane protein